VKKKRENETLNEGKKLEEIRKRKEKEYKGKIKEKE
jgi:hypothetical protein